MSGFGSTDESIEMLTPAQMRGFVDGLHKAKLSLNEKATVDGNRTEIAVLKQQLAMTHEQLRKLIGAYQGLLDRFDNFERQRVIELHSRGGGSTTPEDHGG